MFDEVFCIFYIITFNALFMIESELKGATPELLEKLIPEHI